MTASPGKSWESGGTVVEREPTCQRQMVCMEFSPHTGAIVGRHQWPRRRQYVHELMLMERGAFVLIERGGRQRAPPEGEAPRRVFGPFRRHVAEHSTCRIKYPPSGQRTPTINAVCGCCIAGSAPSGRHRGVPGADQVLLCARLLSHEKIFPPSVPVSSIQEAITR